MKNRPELTKELDGNTFREYYYLKEELIVFCRENGISTTGKKLEIVNRIAHYLDTGEILPVHASKMRKSNVMHIDDSVIIEENIICSQVHRLYFENRIGPSFSFCIEFQKWLKANAGKTYKEAVDAYKLIRQNKHKAEIEPQFEYNTYIRDFFFANPSLSLKQAVACWNYKKKLPGMHNYESSDLIAIKKRR